VGVNDSVGFRVERVVGRGGGATFVLRARPTGRAVRVYTRRSGGGSKEDRDFGVFRVPRKLSKTNNATTRVSRHFPKGARARPPRR